MVQRMVKIAKADAHNFRRTHSYWYVLVVAVNSNSM